MSNFTIAIPRNFLHVNLLLHNYANIDMVIYRDSYFHGALEKKFPGRTLYIDREKKPGKDGWNIFKIFAQNRQYYKNTLSKITELNTKKLIIFLENEPLEVFLMDKLRGEADFELWEEGVMHYVDMFNPLVFRARRLTQILCGYYHGHPFRTRIDRNSIIIRDRFDKKNLLLPPPEGMAIPVQGIAFLSNVLAEDGHITLDAYIKCLKKIKGNTSYPIYYLPHPREGSAVRTAVKSICDEKLIFIDTDEASIKHCMDNDYKYYISPFSTTLLDIGKFNKSFWIPKLFNLNSYHRALSSTRKFPIDLISNTEDLGKKLI